MDIDYTSEYDDYLYILNYGDECSRFTLGYVLANMRKEVEKSYGHLGPRVQCIHCQKYMHSLPDKLEPRFHKCVGMAT